MNGTDGKPFKTRDGETVRLVDLLDEAIENLPVFRAIGQYTDESPNHVIQRSGHSSMTALADIQASVHQRDAARELAQQHGDVDGP